LRFRGLASVEPDPADHHHHRAVRRGAYLVSHGVLLGIMCLALVVLLIAAVT
jgi:hypothetical protein